MATAVVGHMDVMISTPSSLAISYNLKEVGMDYDRSLFGMKLSDCRSLAKALEHSDPRQALRVRGPRGTQMGGRRDA